MNILDKVTTIQQQNQTMLCVGLDTDVTKLPTGYSPDTSGMIRFNEAIIDATRDCCCSYKINYAFYEKHGAAGLTALEKTLSLIPSSHISIADAKRGDIANTAQMYADAILKDLMFDSVTVSPYMGEDSVQPFLSHENKIVFLLALTSNSGSSDFQMLDVQGQPLYRTVIQKSLEWKRSAELGFVMSAHDPVQLRWFRSHITSAPLIIPGVGAQGASVDELRSANAGGCAFVNASRSILFASSGSDFAEKARAEAQRLTALLKPA